jgi:hypothetical protein
MTTFEVVLSSLTAVGTLGAAVFAAWSAWSAKQAAEASHELAEIEAARDDLAWRCVSVELSTDGIVIDSLAGQVAHVVVVNSGPYPLHRARIWLHVGEIDWGPQLFGDLLPGAKAEFTAFFPVADIVDADARLRFTDAYGVAREASARGQVREVDPDPSEWIDAGRSFVGRVSGLSIYERGTSYGPHVTEFDAVEWATDLTSQYASGDETSE